MSYQRRQSKLAAAAAAKEALRTEKKFQNAEKKLQNQAEEALATENKLQNASKQKARAKKKSSAPVYLGMFKAKILIIGPCESGKTVLANFLSDATETSGGEYHPTQGVRILEFECNNIEVSLSRTANCEVELWDCSGDHRFSTCWPAIQKDTNGVVMVYNPDQPNHDKELETWYTQFVQEQWLRDSQCLIFAHHKPMAPERVKTQVPQTLSKVQCVHTNLDEDPDSVREEFKNFLGQVLSNLTDKRDQEELSIMNN